MAQRKSRRWVAAAAIASMSIGWTAATSQADTNSDTSASLAVPGVSFAGELGAELDPRYHAVFLPQLLPPREHAGRTFKKSTLFQIDTPLALSGGQGDVLLRIQAKSKRLVYIEFRF